MSPKGNRLPFGHFSQKTTERLKEIQLHFKKTQRFSVDCRCGNTTLWYGTKMLPKTTKLWNVFPLDCNEAGWYQVLGYEASGTGELIKLEKVQCYDFWIHTHVMSPPRLWNKFQGFVVYMQLPFHWLIDRLTRCHVKYLYKFIFRWRVDSPRYCVAPCLSIVTNPTSIPPNLKAYY